MFQSDAEAEGYSQSSSNYPRWAKQLVHPARVDKRQLTLAVCKVQTSLSGAHSLGNQGYPNPGQLRQHEPKNLMVNQVSG